MCDSSFDLVAIRRKSWSGVHQRGDPFQAEVDHVADLGSGHEKDDEDLEDHLDQDEQHLVVQGSVGHVAVKAELEVEVDESPSAVHVAEDAFPAAVS